MGLYVVQQKHPNGSVASASLENPNTPCINK